MILTHKAEQEQIENLVIAIATEQVPLLRYLLSKEVIFGGSMGSGQLCAQVHIAWFYLGLIFYLEPY
jgi:hypothetical protein